jgi:hypothetical protein
VLFDLDSEYKSIATKLARDRNRDALLSGARLDEGGGDGGDDHMARLFVVLSCSKSDDDSNLMMTLEKNRSHSSARGRRSGAPSEASLTSSRRASR